MSKYWLGEWHPKMGLAVMEQETPQNNSQMIMTILLPKERAELLAGKIVRMMEFKPENSHE